MKLKLTHEEWNQMEKCNLKDLCDFIEKAKTKDRVIHQWIFGKKERNRFNYKKKIFTEGETCVLCGKDATTLHHPKPTWAYESFDEYYNEMSLTPVCHFCHRVGLHATPIHIHFNKKKYGDIFWFYFVGGHIPDDDSSYKLVFKDFKRNLKFIAGIENYFDADLLDQVINKFVENHNKKFEEGDELRC